MNVRMFAWTTAFVSLLTASGVAHAQCSLCTFYGTGAGETDTLGSLGDTGFGYFALGQSTSDGFRGFNTAVGVEALTANAGINNTAVGYHALLSNTSGGSNTAIGFDALEYTTQSAYNTASGMDALNHATGDYNTADGAEALFLNETGSKNTAIGADAIRYSTSGNRNTAVGNAALAGTSGDENIGVGYNAGFNLTTGHYNIDIGNIGVRAESQTIRIGTKGTHTRTIIAGINNSAIFGSPVVIGAAGRLGVQASSVRFKRDIRNMSNASSKLIKLRPVSFRYKEDPKQGLQYGLIAEEVEQVYPELVTHEDDGKVMGVRYDMLPALLLNEVQKLEKENQRKDAQIAALRREMARIDMLTARLNALEEQASLTAVQSQCSPGVMVPAAARRPARTCRAIRRDLTKSSSEGRPAKPRIYAVHRYDDRPEQGEFSILVGRSRERHLYADRHLISLRQVCDSRSNEKRWRCLIVATQQLAEVQLAENAHVPQWPRNVAPAGILQQRHRVIHNRIEEYLVAAAAAKAVRISEIALQLDSLQIAAPSGPGRSAQASTPTEQSTRAYVLGLVQNMRTGRH